MPTKKYNKVVELKEGWLNGNLKIKFIKGVSGCVMDLIII